jgi:acyl-CoA hydrolase
MIPLKSATEAIFKIENGSRIFVHGSAATPRYLLRLLADKSDELEGIEIVAISTLGLLPIDDAIRRGNIFVNSLFVSANIREHVNSPNGSYIPVFLSEIPELFYRNILKLDYAFVHVSPPDKHGFCSLGVSVDVARAACQTARVIIAQINPQMPRTHGDGLIHIDQIDAWDYVNEPLPEVRNEPDDPEIVSQIGRLCADLIEDGATLQMGIGAIPNAVLASLDQHKDLGVHTEMFSDGVIPLIETGVINNSKKKKHPGKVVTGFVLGTRKVYDFIDDNPQVVVLDIDYVNDPNIIRRNPKATSINSGLSIDLSGQVAADTIGTYQFSGFGGQVDFMRGAALSEGGKPIMAMASVTNKGISKICPFLKEGSGVVSTRAHIHYVVTEYGSVNLFGMNLRQRAEALISIAHPEHREALEIAARKRYG